MLNFAVIQVLPFLNNPKDLDLSYKMDLDFWDCFMNGLSAGCVQLWIRSAEPPGEHHYENRNNNGIALEGKKI